MAKSACEFTRGSTLRRTLRSEAVIEDLNLHSFFGGFGEYVCVAFGNEGDYPKRFLIDEKCEAKWPEL